LGKQRLVFIGLSGIAILLLAVILGAAFSKKEHCYYLRIDGLRYTNPADPIAIGSGGAVVVNNKDLPDTLIKVDRREGHFDWQLLEHAYVKLNDSTINKWRLGESDWLESGGRSLSFGQIKERLASYIGSQHYFFVNDLLSEPGQRILSESGVPAVRSLIYYNRGQYDVILLDSSVALKKGGGGPVIRAVLGGHLMGSSLKIELIGVDNSLFVTRKNPLFRNHNINTPTIRTEWQSAHLQLNWDSLTDAVSLLFSQPLVVAFDNGIINEVTKQSRSRTFLLAQDNSVMDKRTFYFEQFSRLFPLPLFTIINNTATGGVDTLLYNGPGGSGFREEPLLHSGPLSRTQSLEVVSPVNPHVTAIGELIHYGPLRLISPFVLLALLVIGAATVLYVLTHPEKYLYYRALSRPASHMGKSTDIERIDLGARHPNKTFWHLRLPVLLMVTLLLCCKLIVATKLCFTHPYYPQLYFIGCLMAFTTPVFLIYFWIRNSWGPVRQRTWIIVADAGLIGAVWVLFFISWQLYGRLFYASYFAAYHFHPGLGSVITALKNQVMGAPNALFRQKYFFIPVSILLIPMVIAAMDAVMALWWMVRKGRVVALKGNPLEGMLRPLLNLNRQFGWLLVLCLISLFISNNYSIVHIGLIFSLYLVFSRLTNRGPGWWAAVGVIGLLAVAAVPIVKGDTGFFINYSLVLPFVVYYISIILFSRNLEKGRHTGLFQWAGALIPCFVIVAGVWAYTELSKPGIEEIGRSQRRVSAIIQKDEALATGGKQYVSDIEFLEIAQLNAIESSQSPSFQLARRDKPFHPFISRGLYPVIINDLNPLVLLDYGGWAVLALLMAGWVLLLLNRWRIWSANFHIEKAGFDSNEFNFAQLLRFIPALIIAGNSIWLLLSLFNVVFFTGRIVNGLGVDSFVDWFELIILCACMGYIIFNQPRPKNA